MGPPDFAALVILWMILSSVQSKLTRGIIKFSLVFEKIDVLRWLAKHKIFWRNLLSKRKLFMILLKNVTKLFYLCSKICVHKVYDMILITNWLLLQVIYIVFSLTNKAWHLRQFNLWFHPHQIVYHERKSQKIRK